MVSMVIMGITLASCAACLQIGMAQYDTARSTTYAAQVLQSEAERIRLANWTSIDALPSKEVFNTEDNQNAKFAFTREISTDGNGDIKSIWLIAEWSGLKGNTHQSKLLIKYAKNGTYDYYYGSNS